MAEAQPTPLDTSTAGTDVEAEFGDLLFVMVNVARHMQIDPEAALRRTNQKFIRRFQAIEAALAEQGRTPEQSSLAEMDALWDQVKSRETRDA
jgi:nucleoside triphosphate diphosphatase